MSGVDWQSPVNHIAVNPGQPEAAEGLAEFADRLGLQGLCFFQTSGSEGTPKWVGLSKEAFLISGRSVNEHFEVTAADHWLIALPLHHVGGFSILARAHLSGSRVTQTSARWNPAHFAQLCEREGITLVSLVPTQVFDLVRDCVPCPDTLRAVIVGGGGMTQALADAAMELGWRVFQSYGMTEACSQVATQPYNSFGAVFDVKSLEILPHWDVTADAEERLILRGPVLARGYARRDIHGIWTWEPITQETGLITRDRVRLWDHGTRRFLQFVGRESGYVKILGELVHLTPLQEQVENLSRDLGWTRPPVLVPMPDARTETRLVLVTEESAARAEGLVARFHETAPPWLRIAAVRCLPQIPRSELGKVQMDALKRLLSADS